MKSLNDEHFGFKKVHLDCLELCLIMTVELIMFRIAEQKKKRREKKNDGMLSRVEVEMIEWHLAPILSR